MHPKSWLLGGALVGSVCAIVWLYTDNRALRAQLAADNTDKASPAALATEPPADSGAPRASTETGPGATHAPRTSPPWRFGSRPSARPSVSDEPAKETREQRRQRRQQAIAAMFGRLEGETAEQYRERMVPFVKATLSGPRDRIEQARTAAEQAASVTPEQRRKLDQAMGDAYDEALALANRALESGDLTPYSRNWSGVLNVAGGMGAILEGTQARIGGILSTEQVDIIYEQGFEWGEYLGVSVPWENLNAPPPPPQGR